MDPQVQFFWKSRKFLGWNQTAVGFRTKVVLMVSWHLRCLECTKMDQDMDPSATKAFPGTTRSHVSLQNRSKKFFVWAKNRWTPAVQGYWFDSSERCTRDPCVDNDRSTSLNLCCKPSQPCSSLTCPHGTLAASDDDWTQWLLYSINHHLSIPVLFNMGVCNLAHPYSSIVLF